VKLRDLLPEAAIDACTLAIDVAGLSADSRKVTIPPGAAVEADPVPMVTEGACGAWRSSTTRADVGVPHPPVVSNAT